MTFLILGLVIFLGVHSVRIVAEDWRTQTRSKIGENAWKGAYTLLSIAGFALLIYGFGQARQQPVVLWPAMGWTRHLAALLMLLSFILLVAAYVPGNSLKARVHHPMILGVKVWALAHLLSNNTLADLVLFGSFVVWAVLDFRAARGRDRALGTVYPAGSLVPTLVTVAVGVVAYGAFAFWAHAVLIGVKPMG
jgi:uncharacterized membrane protein